MWRGVLAKDRAIRLTRVSAWVDMQTQRLQASLPSVEPPLTADELAKQRADRIAAQRRKILCERARQRTLESQKKDMHALGVVVHKCEQKQSFPCPRSPAGAPEGFWSMLLKLHRGRGVVCLSPALAPTLDANSLPLSLMFAAGADFGGEDSYFGRKHLVDASLP